MTAFAVNVACVLVPAAAHGADRFIAAGMDAPLEVRGDGLDGAPATRYPYFEVHDVAALADGSLIVLGENASGDDRARVVGPDGRIRRAVTSARVRGVDVAPLAGGGYAVADDYMHQVLRVAADGTVTRAAGSPSASSLTSDGFSGDGGPGDQALLDSPSGVSPTADGGLLIADTYNQRIRRIGPDGVITTVAGSGQVGGGNGGFAGDGGPATTARLDSPEGVAALPDGSFLIADTGNHRIRRVAPDSTITTVAGTGADATRPQSGPATGVPLASPTDVMPTPDGGYLVATENRVYRVTPAGGVEVLEQPGCARCSASGVSLAPDGGLLLARTETVDYLPPPAPRRLALAVDKSVPRPALRPRIGLQSTIAGTVRVEVYRGRKRVRSVSRATHAARGALPLPRLPAGGLYRVDLTVTGDGQVAFGRTALFTPGRLSMEVAEWAAIGTEDHSGDLEELTRGCHRISSRRVDCEVDGNNGKCEHIVAVRRSPRAARITRSVYGCPMRRHVPRRARTQRMAPLDLLALNPRLR